MDAPAPSIEPRELIDLRNRLREGTVVAWKAGRHEEALAARDRMLDEAYEILYRTLESARRSSCYLEVSAELLQLAGRDEDALADLFEATYLINSHEVPPADLGRLNGALGTLFDQLGHNEDARIHYQRAIENFSKIDGTPIGVARVKNNLAMMVKFEGDHSEAQRLYREALEIVSENEGEDDELAAYVRYNLAVLLQEDGEEAEATELFEQTLAIRREVLGDENPDTAVAYAAVGLAHALMGEDTEALNHFSKAEPVLRENLSNFKEEYESLLGNYVIFLRNIGLAQRASEVEQAAHEALAKVGV